LDDARFRRGGGLPKKGSVDVVSNGAGEELRMVKDIERLKAQLNPGGLCDLRILVQSDVKVIDSRPMEEIASGVTQDSPHLRSKVVRVKIVVALGRGATVSRIHKVLIPRVISLYGTGDVRSVRAVVDRVCPSCERVSAAISKRYGEPGLQSRDARNSPSLNQAARDTLE